MWLAKRKRKLAVVIAILASTFTTVIWFPFGPPPLRLTFLDRTKSPQGVLGVFQLENRLEKSVTILRGFYQPASDRGNEQKPHHATDGSQPFRSETNRTSSAAGSRC